MFFSSIKLYGLVLLIGEFSSQSMLCLFKILISFKIISLPCIFFLTIVSLESPTVLKGKLSPITKLKFKSFVARTLPNLSIMSPLAEGTISLTWLPTLESL